MPIGDVGDGRYALRETSGEFDIVFMDIDKHQYPDAYEIFRVRVGGLVIVDNLIWGGKVAGDDDADSTRGILDYIDKMWNDESYVSSLLPVRDGVGISVRVS